MKGITTGRKPKRLACAVACLLAIVVLAACGDGNAGEGVSRADVEEIVRQEMTGGGASSGTPADVSEAVRREIAALPEREAGLSETEVRTLVQASIAALPEPRPGLTRAEVNEVVASAIEGMPEAKPDLGRAGIEEIVRSIVAEMPEERGGLTAEQAESIARSVVASIPARSSPADYTRFFVDNAIVRYQTDGLDATLAHYNREESVDGQWYVFVIDEDDMIIGHHDPGRRGLDVKGWVGIDANGYRFGPDLLSTTEEGKWVSYVYRNPESGGFGPDHTGALEYKHVWAVRHDGLLFASGWHVDADEYTRFVVEEAIARYQVDGLEETLSHYNSAESVDAQWYVFIASPEGEILGHYNAEELGSHLEEMLEDGSFKASKEGVWVTHEDVNPATGEVEDKHFWLVEHDGLVFGSGWHHGETG